MLMSGVTTTGRVIQDDDDDDVKRADHHDPNTNYRLCWRIDPEESYSDYTIVVKRPSKDDDDVYHVHRNVLAFGPRASGYFATAFRQHKLREGIERTSFLQLDDDEADVLPIILDHIYHDGDGDDSELPVRDVLPLTQLADYLQIKSGMQAKDVISLVPVDHWKISDLLWTAPRVLQCHSQPVVQQWCLESIRHLIKKIKDTTERETRRMHYAMEHSQLASLLIEVLFTNIDRKYDDEASDLCSLAADVLHLLPTQLVMLDQKIIRDVVALLGKQSLYESNDDDECKTLDFLGDVAQAVAKESYQSYLTLLECDVLRVGVTVISHHHQNRSKSRISGGSLLWVADVTRTLMRYCCCGQLPPVRLWRSIMPDLSRALESLSGSHYGFSTIFSWIGIISMYDDEDRQMLLENVCDSPLMHVLLHPTYQKPSSREKSVPLIPRETLLTPPTLRKLQTILSYHRDACCQVIALQAIVYITSGDTMDDSSEMIHAVMSANIVKSLTKLTSNQLCSRPNNNDDDDNRSVKLRRDLVLRIISNMLIQSNPCQEHLLIHGIRFHLWIEQCHRQATGTPGLWMSPTDLESLMSRVIRIKKEELKEFGGDFPSFFRREVVPIVRGSMKTGEWQCRF